MNIVVDVNLLGDNGKEYIEIIVPPYPVAISCKGVYYYRSGSTKQLLRGAALTEFLLSKPDINGMQFRWMALQLTIWTKRVSTFFGERLCEAVV